MTMERTDRGVDHKCTPACGAPVTQIKAAAAEAKVSERTLIAAAERLGVRSWRGVWFVPG